MLEISGSEKSEVLLFFQIKNCKKLEQTLLSWHSDELELVIISNKFKQFFRMETLGMARTRVK